MRSRSEMGEAEEMRRLWFSILVCLVSFGFLMVGGLVVLMVR